MALKFKNPKNEEKIIAAKTLFQRSHPFFAYLIMNLRLINSKEVAGNPLFPEIPTMGVTADGRCFVNEDFIAGLEIPEITGVLCHEVMHIALQHLLRQGERHFDIFNIAADMTINDIIVQDNVKLPSQGLIPNHNGEYKMPDNTSVSVRGKTAEEIYDEILNRLKKQSKKTLKGMRGKNADVHLPAVGNPNSDKDPNGGKCNCGGTFKGGKCDQCGAKCDSEYVGVGRLTPAQKEALRRKWERKMLDAATHAKQRGDLSAGLKRLLDEISSPKLNWRALLHQFITKELVYNYSYVRPGKKSQATGFYMPIELKENLEIMAAIDLSGSISKDEYTEFITELMGIAFGFEQIKMTIMYWDTEVNDEIQVTRGNAKKIKEFEPHGGGGTTMSCVAHYMKENKKTTRVLIYLTDGYVENNPEMPPMCHKIVVLSSDSSSDVFSGRNDIILTRLDVEQKKKRSAAFTTG